MLTPAWKPLRYHPAHDALWRTRARFVGVAAGRGSGKTELARRRIVRFLPVRIPGTPRPMYFYALPTYKQARRVAWQNILDLVPRHWLAKQPNSSEMLIETVWGSQLYVVGLDKPQRIEGDQWCGCVIDESSDQRPGVFSLSVMPALTHKNGWCWRIGVPKRVGIGAAEFKRWCGASPNGEGPVAEESYTWKSSDILTPEQLRYAKENYSPADFDEQYNANWGQAGGVVFYAFDDVLNVSDQISYDPSLPLIVGSDFNVDPMAWVIMQRPERNKLHVIDEIFVRNTNTKATLDLLHNKYKSHQAGWDFYGDAAGRARHTSASDSDYAQIKSDTRFRGARVWYPKSNPPVANRFAACNAMLLNAAGERRVLIHPRCKQLRRDLTDRAYKPGTNEPNDYGDIGHITDAFGYPVHYLFPVRPATSSVSPPLYVVST